MTFRKRDPEFITLFFMSAALPPLPCSDKEVPEELKVANTAGSKTQQYRISKRVEFIDALQVYISINMTI